MFDPEKVERCSFNDHEELHVVDNGEWVAASDYDQLLELYRKAVGTQNSLVRQIRECVDSRRRGML